MSKKLARVGIGSLSAVASVAAVSLVVALGPAATLGSLDNAPDYFEDFRIYYEQARELRAAGTTIVQGWAYPPFAAVSFLPFSLLERSIAYACWAILQIAFCAWLVWRCTRCLQTYPLWQRYVFAVGLVLSSLPVVHCARWGQLSVLIVLLTLLGLESRSWRGPSLLAFAAALKLYPALCAGLYAMRLRWQALARFVLLACLLSCVVPVAIFGFDRTLLVAAASWDAVRALAHVSSVSSQSLSVVVDKWFAPKGVVAGSPGPVLFELPAIARAIITALTSLGLIVATLRASFRRRFQEIALDCVSWLICLALLLKPGWVHYFAMLPLGHALILQYATGWGALTFCGISSTLCAVALIASLVFPPFFYVVQYFGVITVAALCCLAGLCACGDAPVESATP